MDHFVVNSLFAFFAVKCVLRLQFCRAAAKGQKWKKRRISVGKAIQ